MSALRQLSRPTSLLLSASRFDHLPAISLPEVAFAGRSNVGKSSLLNALTASKIARSSRTPGRTQTINFFQCERSHMLVDLPGYGFANVPEAAAEKWTTLMIQYLQSRAGLTVFTLIDARHGVQDIDRQFLELLTGMKRLKFTVVLTKMDKIPQSMVQMQIDKVTAQLKIGDYPTSLLSCSATKNIGIDNVASAVVEAIANFEAPLKHPPRSPTKQLGML